MTFLLSLVKYEKNGDAGRCPLCNEKLIVKSFADRLRKSTEITCVRCSKSELFLGNATMTKTNPSCKTQ